MKKKLILSIFAIIILVCLVVGITYAASNYQIFSGENKIGTGQITFSYSEPVNNLMLTYDGSVTDDVAQTSSKYFEFSVSASATGVVDLDYYIYMTPSDGNTLGSDVVKAYLTSVNDPSDPVTSEVRAFVDGPKLLTELKKFDVANYTETTSSTINDLLVNSANFSFNNNSATQTHYYRLRLWVKNDYTFDPTITDNSYVIQSKTFKFKINVAAKNADVNA